MNSGTPHKDTMHMISPHLFDEKLKEEKRYWLQNLSGKPVAVGLPLDYVRPARLEPQVGSFALSLEKSQHQRLEKICSGNQPLMFAILVAAVKIALHKYSGAQDIMIGTTVHNRHADVSTLNRILAIRDQVKSEDSVKQLLLQVKRTLADAYANQKYSFQRIVELLEIEDAPNRQPLFHVAVTLSNINDPEHLKQLKTDVNLQFSIAQDGTTGEIEYRTRLFKHDTIALFARHLLQILQSMLQNPEAKIGDLDPLSAERRDALVKVANETAACYELDRTIHSLFEEQAAATPDLPAVECKGVTLTFQQLDQKANRLARYLQQIGVVKGDRVGLYLEHSINLVEGILAVLKIGAAYVPLDPSHPVSRTAFVLKDGAINVVLTHSQLAQRIKSDATTTVLLDLEQAPAAIESEQNPGVTVSPKDVAYVIYTSGSTGEPKGVEIEHRSLINYISWARETYVRNERLAFPLYSSLAFDLTVTSLFTPLVTGNLMIIYPDGGLEHPLFDVLRENRIEILKLTPSHLSMIRDRKLKADRVQRIIVGGEAFTTELASECRSLFSEQVEIFNEYGPTEATVGCMIHRFNPASDDGAFVPIGKAAPNTQIYILDERLQPVAENMFGQLFIAGDGLARGYLNRPQLTNDRFVDNPFAPGAKMYKTGDLARWLPQAVIEYAGRKDDQVKFHGHRVELNEIRVALNLHPLVKDSVILIVKEGSNADVMVAHYASDQAIEPAELRAFLAEQIIEETIPNIFSWLAEMPLTGNGKIDHRALPDLEQVRQNMRTRTIVTPKNQTQELLASIWANVLGREEISIHDDFFELGGHSLLAHQIISRTRTAFQVDVPLRTLFEAATIEKLAAAVDRLIREKAGAKIAPIVPVDRSRNLPLSYPQQRLWFVEQLRDESNPYNIYPYFQLNGPLNVAALQQSVNEIIRRHESLRTVFRFEGNQPVQIIQPELKIEIPTTDLASLSEEERNRAVEEITQEEIKRPFDLEKGPLVRARLLRLREEQHLLCLAMHHIVFDAWSMSLFYRELTVIYKAFTSRTAPKLPELSVQYGDYSKWQREWLGSGVLRTQVAYWREQLAGIPPLLDLLPERPRPAAVSDQGAYLNVIFPGEISEKIIALSRRQGCTIFMTLLAAFQTLLSFYTGKKDIVVGSDVANRNRPETENLIGFFVNTLVLRTDLSGDPAFRSLLGRVREVCLDAYAHQDLPFEKLVEELNPERNDSRSPLFQIMFGFIPDNPATELNLSELEVKFVPPDNRSSVFDLTLYMVSTPTGLGGTVRYKTDLYSAAMVTQLLADFELLLARISEHPDLSISQLHAALSESRQKEQLARETELKELRKNKFKTLKRISEVVSV